MTENKLNSLSNIKAIFLDMDGVLTNCDVIVMDDGELVRKMNVRDGYALKRAVDAGLTVAIISAGYSKGAEIRFANFGLQHIHMSVKNKIEVFNQIITDENITANEVVYMGDDIPDLECISAAAIGVAPNNASHEVLEIADYVTSKNGGDAAVRELIEMVLRAQNKW